MSRAEIKAMLEPTKDVEQKPAPQRQILMAVAHSEASQRACQWAADNLLRPDDMVHLFHVVEMPLMDILVGADDIPVTYTDPEADRRNVIETEKYINKEYVPMLKGIAHTVEIVHFSTSAQDVGEAVCERAKALDAAAVVLASQNKPAIQRLFLGSTCSYCSNHCTQTVVITR